MRRISFFIGILSLLAQACTSGPELPDDVRSAKESLIESPDYNQHIKPILSDRCFKCHGPDKNKIEAGLQLTSLESASAKLESGNTALVPGHTSRSELVRRILSNDPDEMMPPPESHLALSAEEKALLIRWVEAGAEYKEHWSLTRIEEPDLPQAGRNWVARWGIKEDEETRWVRNEIDHFVIKKLRDKELMPSPQADPEVLLRRVYMDLTGLPPSNQEVENFLTDPSDAAYEKIVDILLQSPHFGEHLAVGWLDLARYADTHGYQDDGMRNAYPYRDWVIRAFNQNLPFDKFVTWQLAGDLLPNPSKDMVIATSFNRQHPQSQEGGIVAEEYLTEYVADRTNTFGKAFLGITMECARCHDHKYDPISAQDYYSVYAFFNQNRETGAVPYSGEASPTLMLPDTETEKTIHYIREKIAVAEEEVSFKNPLFRQNFKSFLKTVDGELRDEKILSRDLLIHHDFERRSGDRYKHTGSPEFSTDWSGDRDRKPREVPGKFGRTALYFEGDCGLSIISDADREAGSTPERFYKGLNFERNQPFSISLWINPVKQIAGPILTKNNGEFEGYRGYDLTLNSDQTLTFRMMYVYPANGIEIRTTDKIAVNEWTHVAFTYDGSGKAEGCRLFLNGNPAHDRVLTDNLTKSILHDDKGNNWSFMPLEIGKNFLTTIKDIQMDEFRIYKRRLSALEISSIYQHEDAVTARPGDERLFEFYVLNYDSAFKRRTEALAALRFDETKAVTPVEEVMVMDELPEDQKRKTFVLDRGVYDSPMEEVTAETPVKLGRLPEGFPRNRLGLARWLLHRDNPLFSRVMVNRFWLHFFGNGIVKTQEDFGNQGELPTHPELLDWLAVQFRQDGWNTKAFLKRIVMSATYRQSSVANSDARENDPENRWLARGPAHAYSAEQVRDLALTASGLLSRKIGGPSVYPYQPKGLWEALATRNAVNYKQQHGDSLYRRSMYTVWKRSSPPPMMLNFDAADRQLCTVRRQRTATPLQALVMMNDPQFVEAARVLAEKAIALDVAVEVAIRDCFLAITSRPPRPTELAVLMELLDKERKHFSDHRDEAVLLQKNGEYPVNTDLDPVQVAAFTVVVNTIMNSDEALIKR